MNRENMIKQKISLFGVSGYLKQSVRFREEGFEPIQRREKSLFGRKKKRSAQEKNKKKAEERK